MTDQQMQALLIEALEYNAAIVAAASLYFGNCGNNARVQKKAKDHFLTVAKAHEESVKKLVNGGEEKDA